MAICIGKYNFTFAVYGSLHATFFELTKDGGMTGILGERMDRLIGPLKKRKCKFKPVISIGHLLENGSFDGLLGEFEKKNCDFYYRFETYFQNHQNMLDFSGPLTAQHFQAAQFLDPVETSQVDLSLFFTQNIDFIYQLLIAFALIYLTILLFIAHQSLKIKKTLFRKLIFENIIYNLIGLKNNLVKSSKIGLILLFYSLYVFLFLNLLSCNMKTEQVIVKTNHIIDSDYKLLNTPKVACWFESEYDYTLASKSPKETFLYKVFDSKKFRIPVKDEFGELIHECKFLPQTFTFRALNLLFKNKLSNYFILMNRTTALIIAALLTKMFEEYSLYIGEKSFYEMIYVSLIRKTLDEKKKEFLIQKMLLESEAGLYLWLVQHFDYDLLEFTRKSTKIYSNVEAFVDDHVSIDKLKIKYFEPVFLFLIAIWFLTFLSFLAFSKKQKTIHLF